MITHKTRVMATSTEVDSDDVKFLCSTGRPQRSGSGPDLPVTATRSQTDLQ